MPTHIHTPASLQKPLPGGWGPRRRRSGCCPAGRRRGSVRGAGRSRRSEGWWDGRPSWSQTRPCHSMTRMGKSRAGVGESLLLANSPTPRDTHHRGGAAAWLGTLWNRATVRAAHHGPATLWQGTGDSRPRPPDLLLRFPVLPQTLEAATGGQSQTLTRARGWHLGTALALRCRWGRRERRKHKHRLHFLPNSGFYLLSHNQDLRVGGQSPGGGESVLASCRWDLHTPGVPGLACSSISKDKARPGCGEWNSRVWWAQPGNKPGHGSVTNTDTATSTHAKCLEVLTKKWVVCFAVWFRPWLFSDNLEGSTF